MNRFNCILLVMLCSIICGAQQIKMASHGSASQNSTIDDYVKRIIARYQIPGVSLAVVQNGTIIHQRNYGFANLEHKVRVSDTTLFRLYSLTKPFISVAVFQLIEQGKLDLNDPVSDYIDDLPESWQWIEIRNLLTHSSGLPDMAPYYEFQDLTEAEAVQKVFGQDLRFKKGEKYDYNQTGFWMLQKILEKASGKSLEPFMGEYQFNGAPMTKNALFSSDSRDVIPNRATPYFFFSKGNLAADLSYLQGRYLLSANGLNIDMPTFLKWDKALRNNELLKSDTKAKMWSAFEYGNSNKKFGYGWDYHEVNGHTSYGFSGSFVTAYRIFPDADLSIIFLSNGLGHWYDIEQVIDYITGLVDTDLKSQHGFLFENLLNTILDKDLEAFKAACQKSKNGNNTKSIDFENLLNRLGYMLMNLKRHSKAMEVFKLNTQEFPKSWNVWDSLGEGYEHSGDTANAIINYKKSIEINPKNGHALERLRVLQDNEP